MGKTYRKVIKTIPISESINSDHSRNYSSRAKRNTQHKIRKINDSTDWINSEDKIPVVVHPKIKKLKHFDYRGIYDSTPIAPHILGEDVYGIVSYFTEELVLPIINKHDSNGPYEISLKDGDVLFITNKDDVNDKKTIWLLYRSYHVPCWCNEEMNIDKLINEIVNNDVVNYNKEHWIYPYAKICKKQFERRGNVGIFKGHDYTKDFTLPPYDV